MPRQKQDYLAGQRGFAFRAASSGAGGRVRDPRAEGKGADRLPLRPWVRRDEVVECGPLLNAE